MKPTILYTLTKNSYGGAFVRYDGSTGSDQRNDADCAAHFRTHREAAVFARRCFGEYWHRLYTVERLYRTEAGLFCEVAEEPGTEGTEVITYRGIMVAGCKVS